MIREGKEEVSVIQSVLRHPVVMGIGFALIVFCYIVEQRYTALDEQFVDTYIRIAALRPVLDPVFLGLFWMTAAVFFASIMIYFMFTNQRRNALGVMVIVIVAGLFIGEGMKHLINVSRPDPMWTDWIPGVYSELIPSPIDDHDFPAQSSMVAAALYVFFYSNSLPKWKQWLLHVYVTVTILIRPYLGFNHLSGTVAGAIIGLYVGLIVKERLDDFREASMFSTRERKVGGSIVLFTIVGSLYSLKGAAFTQNFADSMLESMDKDLDLRMLIAMFGIFLGLSLFSYPKEIRYDLSDVSRRLAHYIAILVAIWVLLIFENMIFLTPVSQFGQGILISLLTGLWVSTMGPMLVHYLTEASGGGMNMRRLWVNNPIRYR